MYITDALKIISENTSKIASGTKIINERFYDIIHPKNDDDTEEEQTAEDIILNMKNKIQILGEEA